jgi:hypothetical protein
MGRFYVRGELIPYKSRKKALADLKARFPLQAIVVDDRQDEAGRCGIAPLANFFELTSAERVSHLAACESQGAEMERESQETRANWERFRHEEAIERIKNDSFLSQAERDRAVRRVTANYDRFVALQKSMSKGS